MNVALDQLDIALREKTIRVVQSGVDLLKGPGRLTVAVGKNFHTDMDEFLPGRKSAKQHFNDAWNKIDEPANPFGDENYNLADNFYDRDDDVGDGIANPVRYGLNDIDESDDGLANPAEPSPRRTGLTDDLLDRADDRIYPAADSLKNSRDDLHQGANNHDDWRQNHVAKHRSTSPGRTGVSTHS